MGLSEKVVIVLVITALTQIAYKHCMPSISRKSSLKRYLDNLKPVKNGPSSTSYTPSRVNKSPKPTFGKRGQNARINKNSFPQKSLYKTYNFPENDYPLDNSPRDPFSFRMDLNKNHQVNTFTQRSGSPNSQCSTINDLKKEMKRKRKLLSNIQRNDGNSVSIKEPSLMKLGLGTDPTSLLDQESFPEVQYPLTPMETWEPNYWNYLPFTQGEKRFDSFPRETLKPKIKDDISKPFTGLRKTKASKFLKSYDVFKGGHIRTSTENSKRSSIGQKGLNFTKTATCEKVSEDFLSAGLVSKNVSDSKQTLESTPKKFSEFSKCKVKELENMSSSFEPKNNIEDSEVSKELINIIIDQILKLESTIDETNSTSLPCNSNADIEKSMDISEMPSDDSTNGDTLCTLIDNSLNYKVADFASEELLMVVSNDTKADSLQIVTLPITEEPELNNTTFMEGPLNVRMPLSFSENITHGVFENASSTDPTIMTPLSNSNGVPSSTSIIIIPINNNIVGKSQSHVFTSSPDTPIILYIPSTQSSDSPTQTLPNEQYVSVSLDKIVQDSQLRKDVFNMAPLRNDCLTSTDLVSEILNCNSHNGSSLPMYEPLPTNSMYFNNESSPSSIREKQFNTFAINQSLTDIRPSIILASSESLSKRPEENFNVNIDTLPQTPDFKHPLLDFPGSDFTLLHHGPYNDVLGNELPVITREINLDHQNTNVSSKDLCIQKHNVTSEYDLSDGLELNVENGLETPLYIKYIDDASVRSEDNVSPLSSIDDIEIIKNNPLSFETVQYSLPVSNDKITSPITEKLSDIAPQHRVETQLPTHNDSPTAPFPKATELLVSPTYNESPTAPLPKATELLVSPTPVSPITTNSVQQPLNNSPLLSSMSNLPPTTDTTLQSTLLPEFYKVSLLLNKMLSHLETYTNNNTILSPVSESDRLPLPISKSLSTSQVPTDGLTLPVNDSFQQLLGTETPLKSLELTMDKSLAFTPIFNSSKDRLLMSLDEPLLPSSLLTFSDSPSQPLRDKLALTLDSNSVPSPIKDHQLTSQIPIDELLNKTFQPLPAPETPTKRLDLRMDPPLQSTQDYNNSKDSLRFSQDKAFQPLSVMESAIESLELGMEQPRQSTPDFNYSKDILRLAMDKPFQPRLVAESPIESLELQMDPPLLSTPVFDSLKDNLPLSMDNTLISNFLIKPSDSLPKPIKNILPPISESYSAPLPIKKPDNFSQPTSDNIPLQVDTAFNHFLATDSPVETLEQTDEPQSMELNPVFDPSKGILPLSIDNTLVSYSLSKPFDNPTQAIHKVQLAIKKPELTCQTSTDKLCLPINETFQPLLVTKTPTGSLQQDGTLPTTSTFDNPTNCPYTLEHTIVPSNSVLSESIPLDETLLLSPVSETPIDDTPCLINNVETPLCQYNSAKDTSTKDLHLHRFAMDTTLPLNKNLVFPDIFKVSNGVEDVSVDNLQLTETKELPIKPLITNYNSATDEPRPSISLAEIPVHDQSNPTDDLLEKEVLNTTAVLTSDLSANNPISDPFDAHESYSIGDSPMMINHMITEISNSITDTEHVSPQMEHFLSSEHNVNSDIFAIDFSRAKSDSQNNGQPAAYPEKHSLSDTSLSGLPLDTIFLSGETLDNHPSQINKSNSTSKIVITKALLESLLPKLKTRESSLPISQVLPIKSKLLDKMTNIVEPSFSAMTQLSSSQDSSRQKDKTQSDLDLPTDLTYFYQFSDINDDILTLPVDNTFSRISNVHISAELPLLDKMHDDNSAIVTDDLVHKIRNVTPPSDSAAVQLPTTVDNTSLSEDSKREVIILTGDKTTSNSKLPQTKAILKNILSDIDDDKRVYNLETSDYYVTDDIPLQHVDKINMNVNKNDKYASKIEDIFPAANKTLSKIPSLNSCQESPQLINRLSQNKPHIFNLGDTQDRNEMDYNPNNLLNESISKDVNHGPANDVLGKLSIPSSKLLTTKALLENVLSDIETKHFLLPVDKVSSIASTSVFRNKHYDISPVSGMTKDSPSQMSVDNSPANTVFSTTLINNSTSENKEDISLSEGNETHLEKMPDNKILNNNYDSRVNMVSKNLTNDPSSTSNTETLLLSNERLSKISPAVSKLPITKALLQSVLSEIDARGFLLPVAKLPSIASTSGLDKTHINMSPVSNMIKDNPSQLLVHNNPPEKIIDISLSETDEKLSERVPKSQILDDKQKKDENILTKNLTDCSYMTADSLSLPNEKLGMIEHSVSKLPFTKALLENVLSNVNDRGFSQSNPKALPKTSKSVLDKTLYVLEAPIFDIINENPLSPVDEIPYENEPFSEIYYVLPLSADNHSLFDIPIVQSPMDKLPKDTLEIMTDDEEDKNEHLPSDNQVNDLPYQMDEKLSLTDDVVRDPPRTKSHLGSKIFITKALLEKVLSDITDAGLSAKGLPDIPLT